MSVLCDRLVNMAPHFVKELQEFYHRVDSVSGESRSNLIMLKIMYDYVSMHAQFYSIGNVHKFQTIKFI